MAKAKKEKTETFAAEPKATPAKSAAQKPKAASPTAAAAAPKATAAKAKKAAKPAAPPAAPLIDTSMAALAAAKMVANRDRLSQPAGEKRESGSFKKLKEQFLKPTTQGPGGVLQPSGAQKKFNPILGGRNQIGHNQTFGADVNRTGIPRRTGG